MSAVFPNSHCRFTLLPPSIRILTVASFDSAPECLHAIMSGVCPFLLAKLISQPASINLQIISPNPSVSLQ